MRPVFPMGQQINKVCKDASNFAQKGSVLWNEKGGLVQLCEVRAQLWSFYDLWTLTVFDFSIFTLHNLVQQQKWVG